jgi:DNA-directed RNA polymerase subunit L
MFSITSSLALIFKRVKTNNLISFNFIENTNSLFNYLLKEFLKNEKVNFKSLK